MRAQLHPSIVVYKRKHTFTYPRAMSLVAICSADGCTNLETASGHPLRHCRRCASAVYCGTECQRAHWKAHKPRCLGGILGPRGDTLPRAALTIEALSGSATTPALVEDRLQWAMARVLRCEGIRYLIARLHRASMQRVPIGAISCGRIIVISVSEHAYEGGSKGAPILDLHGDSERARELLYACGKDSGLFEPGTTRFPTLFPVGIRAGILLPREADVPPPLTAALLATTGDNDRDERFSAGALAGLAENVVAFPYADGLDVLSTFPLKGNPFVLVHALRENPPGFERYLERAIDKVPSAMYPPGTCDAAQGALITVILVYMARPNAHTFGACVAGSKILRL